MEKNSASKGLIVIAVIAVLVVAGIILTKKPMTSTSTSEKVTVTPVKTVIMKKTVYKDGTYTVEGDYVSPGGPEQLGVTLTLKEGKIVASEVVSKATRPNSVKFQGIFVANYKSMVVGKNIDEVKLDKVSGSSLTPKGFNDAVEKVKAEAKS